MEQAECQFTMLPIIPWRGSEKTNMIIGRNDFTSNMQSNIIKNIKIDLKKTCDSCNGEGDYEVDGFDPTSRYGHTQSIHICDDCNGRGYEMLENVNILYEEVYDYCNPENEGNYEENRQEFIKIIKENGISAKKLKEMLLNEYDIGDYYDLKCDEIINLIINS